jgi:YggT family protein
MTQALYFIVKTLTQLVLLLYLLRLWLPLVRADFRNPVAQGILRLTSPLIIPIRRFVPSVGRLDTAVVLVVYLIQFLVLMLLMTITQQELGTLNIALLAVLELCILSLNLFFFAIMIRIILSWIAPNTYNPVSAIASNLAEPVLSPFRRLVPSLGGLDISPIFAIVMLKATEIYLQSLAPYLLHL